METYKINFKKLKNFTIKFECKDNKEIIINNIR